MTLLTKVLILLHIDTIVFCKITMHTDALFTCDLHRIIQPVSLTTKKCADRMNLHDFWNQCLLLDEEQVELLTIEVLDVQQLTQLSCSVNYVTAEAVSFRTDYIRNLVIQQDSPPFRQLTFVRIRTTGDSLYHVP